MVPTGNKAKRLSSINHTTKAIRHLHHHRPMPVEVVAKIFNSESKGFQKVADEKHFCKALVSTTFLGKHKENILP